LVITGAIVVALYWFFGPNRQVKERLRFKQTKREDGEPGPTNDIAQRSRDADRSQRSSTAWSKERLLGALAHRSKQKKKKQDEEAKG
jgi:hypothetical protein